MQGTEPLETPLETAYGSDLLSLIVGRDMDADSRQRNREFVRSGNHNRGKKCSVDRAFSRKNPGSDSAAVVPMNSVA